MSEEPQNIQGREGVFISLELNELLRKLLIAVVSFLLTAILASATKGLFKSNAAIASLFAAVIFISLFFAMRFAKTYVRSYVEKYGWVVIPPVLAALFVASSLKPVVFFALFLLHAAACVFLRTLKNTARLGIELIMLITVLGSFAYGPKAGAIIGAVAMLMDYALTARFSYFVPVTTGSYLLIGLFAGSFSSAGITAVGITATIIYNIFTSLIIVAFMGGHIEKCLRFGLSNIALNFMLFTTAAPWLLSIIS